MLDKLTMWCQFGTKIFQLASFWVCRSNTKQRYGVRTTIVNTYALVARHQCCRFGRYIGEVTPKNTRVYYTKNYFFGSKYPKHVLFNFENKTTA